MQYKQRMGRERSNDEDNNTTEQKIKETRQDMVALPRNHRPNAHA